MLFSSSSVFITLIMSTVMILLFEVLVSKIRFTRLLRMDVVLALAIVIFLRLLFPVELPFTITIPFPQIMNVLQSFLSFQILPFMNILQLLCVIEVLGAFIHLVWYTIDFKKCNAIIEILKKTSNNKRISDYFEIDRKYDYPVYIGSNIVSPMVIGFKKMIFVPAMDLSDTEMKDILTHELQHLKNHDNLLKQFLNILKIIYWWFLPIYWFSNKVQLVLEMRVDKQTTKGYSKQQVVNYANVLLKLKKKMLESSNRTYASLSISSIFLIGDDERVLSYRINYLLESSFTKRTNVILLCIILLLPFLSNIIVFEPYIAPPLIDYTTEDADALEKGFILKHDDGTYSLYTNGIIKEISNLDDDLIKTYPMVIE